MKILAIGPSGRAKVYSSYRAASRELSGDGSDRRRSSIIDKVETGGGFVSRVWVQPTSLRSTTRI